MFLIFCHTIMSMILAHQVERFHKLTNFIYTYLFIIFIQEKTCQYLHNIENKSKTLLHLYIALMMMFLSKSFCWTFKLVFTFYLYKYTITLTKIILTKVKLFSKFGLCNNEFSKNFFLSKFELRPKLPWFLNKIFKDLMT